MEVKNKMVYKKNKNNIFIKCNKNCQDCNYHPNNIKKDDKNMVCIEIKCDLNCADCKYSQLCTIKKPTPKHLKKAEEKIEDLSQQIENLKQEIQIHHNLQMRIKAGEYTNKKNRTGDKITTEYDIMNLYDLHDIEEELLEKEEELNNYINKIREGKQWNL